ncbi:MAG: hypothetical protein A3F84_18770 [Candidatus Handelsmanbacteria bacterium RIFCSPLOWO2_12_FULL_64_10]|uniref:Glycosyl hydrolase 36 catalytic domain-containing protein n=1 Tax=Handelsmanbacteria sp. (strain RIFCSPLOWO2_12_FULL_64_10) TaxID=1817868 RepID=A0A1F6D2F5_HANXR|nr:MAG: hypothetical protein A3F84_18770 [Candidatus Handelsmanbacteria bacterium RIFCSPLOWO2_12_FULL_64_10]
MIRANTGSPFDAAPFGRPLDGEAGVVWEDPREIHRVVAHFKGALPKGLRLQYWRSRWPQQRLPKDRTPGGGAVGWWELGSWYTGEWQTADAEVSLEGDAATFTFYPLHRREFPNLSDFPATFRTTLKVRLTLPAGSPDVGAIEAYTDSIWDRHTLTVLRASGFSSEPLFEAFNGYVEGVRAISADAFSVTVWRTKNPDPNSFDRTLLTVRAGQPVTVLVDDLSEGPVYVPDAGICVVEGREDRDFAGVCSEVLSRSRKGVYDAVAGLPEQTWARAWREMPPKRAPFYLPLGTDGGRHRFGLRPDGSVFYRTNNRYLIRCPGRDTPRLSLRSRLFWRMESAVAGSLPGTRRALKGGPAKMGSAVAGFMSAIRRALKDAPAKFPRLRRLLSADRERMEVSFGLPGPFERTIQEGCLPIGVAAWEVEGVRIEQVAFATLIGGTDPDGPPPPGDASGVWLGRFAFHNPSGRRVRTGLLIRFLTGEKAQAVRLDRGGLIRSGGEVRGCLDGRGQGGLHAERDGLRYVLDLSVGARHEVVVKLPYVPPEGEEVERLKALSFEAEREAVAGYWRRRLDEGMRLVTPEPALNEFHRAHAGHLLINCEREPGAERRFARVGSFRYGAFGNESCMMVVDLDRRGYHREARACLDAFLRYQGTAGLPGDFSSQEGVLYGACGYESGGYNQHHGWILWCLVEHYRFTRDGAWLGEIAPNLISAADWIIREVGRTRGRDDIGRGLLPHGSLEDVGDWWQWLSTNAYTWRGLDAAAWGLGQAGHPGHARVAREAEGYREAILRAFREAAGRSPVVRLRDGACVPHFPSHVHRRGRGFGWICETLEGAMHLLITRLIDPASREALYILKDYEDNLYLSEQYGYPADEFERRWFDWGGFSMQACLLLGVEAYLYRDDVKHALRAAFNGIAANYFPDTRMLTEHALPGLGDWRGDHYKSSDEANAAGWLRYLFVREEGEDLLLGQAVPRDWLRPGARVGVEDAATHFGPMGLIYEADGAGITARLAGPTRNPPGRIRLRFRPPEGRRVRSLFVNGEAWADRDEEWVHLPGDVGEATVRAEF